MAKKATLALGCFWGPDYTFSRLPGVLQTVVGYAGGTEENPTYENVGGHTETVEVTYDPERISYEEILGYFWKAHNPTVPHKTQYQSIIFYHDDAQKDAAEKSKAEEERRRGAKVLTEIRPAGTLWRAEEYHQKYYEKHGIESGVC